MTSVTVLGVLESMFLSLLTLIGLHLVVHTDSVYAASNREFVYVYWNASNPLFESGQSGQSLDFWEGDSLTIYCPHYSSDDPRDSQDWEYYRIYMVNKQMHDLCVINDTGTADHLLECNEPDTQAFLTMLILSFSPTGRDFIAGNEYYIISTSGGSSGNIENQYHGACWESNMKLGLRFHGRREDSGNTGGTGGGSGSNNRPDPPTRPTLPPTRRTTTATTTTEATTPRPAISTAPPTLPPTRLPKPLGGGGSSKGSGTDGEPVPGSDGFPSDETVIHAGGAGNRGGRDSNINSGVIDDSGAEDSGISLHGAYHTSCILRRHWTLVVGLVISYVLAHADIVRGR